MMFGPNIMGNTVTGGLIPTVGSSGCIATEASGAGYDWGEEGAKKLRIDASLSSAIFGGSSAVQPAAIRLLPCIKF